MLYNRISHWEEEILKGIIRGKILRESKGMKFK